ncbi:MAG: DUF3450 domain-containing protein [Desulfuromonadaceae bacterium]|nr:DUF3450 domain-containing protein [Desulfuromonadaceae bacterium]
MKLNVLLCLLWLCAWTVCAEDFPHQVEAPLQRSLALQQQTQQQADSWEQEKQQLLREYEQLQQQQRQLEQRRDSLLGQTRECTAQIAEAERAIREAKRLTSESQPFLEQSVVRLRQAVAEDLPFLTPERTERLERLQQAIDDPQLAAGEKYRRLMESLQIEADYGRSVEVSQQNLSLAGQNALMNVLRVGRLALFAQSLDGRRGAFYDVALARWQPLDERWQSELQRALAMGSKQRPVDLTTLPLGRMANQ